MKFKRKPTYFLFIALIGLSYGGWLYWSIQQGRFQSPKDSQVKEETQPSKTSQKREDKKTSTSAPGKNSKTNNPLNLKMPSPPQSQVDLFKKRYQKLREIQQIKKKQAPLQPQNFEDLLQLANDLLPKKSESRELKAHQVHATPASLRLAGKAFGEIKEILAKQSELEPEAENFYTSCSKNQELMDTVRALCLTNLGLIYRQRDETFNMQDYPARLRRLANEILQLEY